MKSRDAARKVARVLEESLPVGRIYGPSHRIEDAWVPRETTGSFDHGIAIVIDSELDREWIKTQFIELIKRIRHEPLLNRARRGVHIWNGDKVDKRYGDASWYDDLLDMDPEEIEEGSLEALYKFTRQSSADQVIVLTTAEKLINSDKHLRLPAKKLTVIFLAADGERDACRIKEIPCFGVQPDSSRVKEIPGERDQDDQERR